MMLAGGRAVLDSSSWHCVHPYLVSFLILWLSRRGSRGRCPCHWQRGDGRSWNLGAS